MKVNVFPIVVLVGGGVLVVLLLLVLFEITPEARLAAIGTGLGVGTAIWLDAATARRRHRIRWLVGTFALMGASVAVAYAVESVFFAALSLSGTIALVLRLVLRGLGSESQRKSSIPRN